MPSKRVYRGNVGRPRKYRFSTRIDMRMDMELYIEFEKIREMKNVTMTALFQKYVREGIEREKMIPIKPERVTYERWFTEHKDDKDEDLK